MSIRKVIEPEVFEFFDYKRYTFSLGLQNDEGAWLSGHSASRYEPKIERITVSGEMGEQARLAHEKIETLLNAAGMSWDNVVKFNDYVTVAGLGTYDLVADVRTEKLGKRLAATTPVIVDRLLRAGALIEIEVIAARNPGEVYALTSHTPGLPRAAAVRSGDLVYVSGQLATDEKGDLVGEGDIETQTRQVYNNLQSALASAGVTTKHIVKTIDYVHWSARPQYKRTAAIRKEFLSEPYPAATGIVVNRLPHPRALIQVDAYAYDGERSLVNPGWPLDGLTFSPGIRAGDHLFLEGIFATDPVSGEVQHPGDIVEQTRWVYKKLIEVLEAGGLSEGNMVKTVEFVVGTALPDYRGTAKVREELFSAPYPSATGCVVPELLRPEMLIEVDSVARAK